MAWAWGCGGAEKGQGDMRLRIRFHATALGSWGAESVNGREQGHGGSRERAMAAPARRTELTSIKAEAGGRHGVQGRRSLDSLVISISRHGEHRGRGRAVRGWKTTAQSSMALGGLA